MGGSFNARSGSTVTIGGGSFDRNFNARSGSTVAISGGSFGRDFNAFAGSDVEFVGGEFRLNGVAFAGPTITLQMNDTFTGTLEDGSAFIFTPLVGDQLNNVMLTPATLPDIDLTPIIVNAASPDGPNNLRAGQALTLQDGGALGTDQRFQAVGATLDIEGGALGNLADIAESTVNINSGSVSVDFNAFSGSMINISGGSVGGNFNVNADSTVNISGGSVGSGFGAGSGSTVNISGGSVGSGFDVISGSTVNISGGSLGIDFNAEAGSDVEFIGGAFKLNGTNFAGSTITLQTGDVFTGTLQDGSPLIFFNDGIRGDFDQLNNVTLTEVALPDIDTAPFVVNAANPSGPHSLGGGQVLTLQDGGSPGCWQCLG